MTPPSLRRDAVQRRLLEMQRLLDVLEQYRDVTGDELRQDIERRLVVERILQQLVDLAVKINLHVAATAGRRAVTDYFTTFEEAAAAGLLPTDLAASLAPSTGLRNRLVHEYDEIDLEQVAAAVPDAADGYGRYVRTVAGWLDDQGR